MKRKEALKRLSEIIGRDLRKLATEYEVTVQHENRKMNKGWAGQVIEKHLGLPLNSSRAPNAGSWELKTVPLKYLKNGELTVKETMAITMINPEEVAKTNFENSHLLAKLKRMVVSARIWESPQEERSILRYVTTFDLDDPAVYNQVKADYELARETIRTQGAEALKSQMGEYIQPRTKGKGHGSSSRAFYAKKVFLKKFIFASLRQEKKL